MDPESGSFYTCKKHPSQAFTGFCSTCLLERLSSVDPADRTLKHLSRAERDELLDGKSLESNGFSSATDEAGAKVEYPFTQSQRKSCEVRERITLLSLFHMNDNDGEHVTKSESQGEALTADKAGVSSFNGYESTEGVKTYDNVNGFSLIEHKTGVSSSNERPETVKEVKLNADGFSLIEDKKRVSFTKAGVSSSASFDKGVGADENFDASSDRVCSVNGYGNVKGRKINDLFQRTEVGRDVDSEIGVSGVTDGGGGKYGILREKNMSFWLATILSRKLQKWKVRSKSDKRGNHRGRACDAYSETMVECRGSCDCRASIDSSSASWEETRHSWDSKFYLKPIDLNGVNRDIPGFPSETGDSFLESSPLQSRKVGLNENNKLTDLKPCNDMRNITKVSPSPPTLDDDLKPISSEAVLRSPLRESQNLVSHCQGLTGSNQSRKSHGWGKGWSRTLSSPICGFVQKHETNNAEFCERRNVLERSLSGSWQELQRENHRERNRAHPSRGDFQSSSSVSSRTLHSVKSNGGGNQKKLQGLQPNLQKKDFIFGRSRSVHYASPSYIDSGLLRFYLTPLRSSRKKGRVRSSRSFSRGIMGFC
ncbi:UPF0503 protein At3g09070, chloroplastic [Amborella trichopoda]|uniref:Uncharacterized protein n=1 Tax=Amborella trichopoda TaxID=13333 RepID=W1PR51_AMBTC|nr:UPF0503 protein At3g09070, chloroplastic [Amborella trichopoda]ERN10299.1 hypothetical protein AMTR_s00177p00043080 [Amborella trichopoda]|eukprot:XP_006848718.1 UPF0503 protein At3g09070, chloroplastic [Amborella trichopoda]